VPPLLAKVLHVRRTELPRTLQLAGFAIVVGWAMYTAFSAAQSIFLNRAGPHAYPLFFIVLALAVWPMDALQGALTRRFGVGRAFRMNLGANAVAAIGVFVAYTVREDATVAFVAYVIYSVAFELVMLHFWSFVTQHFNVIEGKRVFPVIAAGSCVGYILSGVTTTVVAVFATEPLIFIWALGSIAAAVMTVFCVLLFVYLLNLPFQLWPQPNAATLLVQQFVEFFGLIFGPLMKFIGVA